DEGTALVLLSEIGPDVSRFATAKQFTSWLGLCPQHQASACKVRGRRVRRGGNRAGQALRMAAQGCHHAKHALGACYRRIQGRRGGIAPAEEKTLLTVSILAVYRQSVPWELDRSSFSCAIQLTAGATPKPGAGAWTSLPAPRSRAPSCRPARSGAYSARGPTP